MSLNSGRLAAVVSPLRRALLAAAREREGLPDIPDAQIEVLRALEHGGATGPSELAAALGLNRSTVSNLLAAMERADLIVRQGREDDRRQVDVVASGRARGYLARFDAASSDIVDEALTSLSSDQRAILISAVPALEHLRDALVVMPPRTRRMEQS